MDNRTAYQQKVEAQINEWSAKLDVLKAKADKASAEAKLEINKKLESLHDLQGQAKAVVDKIKASSTDAWNDAKHGIEESWTKIATAVETAWSKVA